ncbi:MAG: hypothetical protein CMJ49_11415, partial [Planctomycetaceae bacterium]|nr:hypothetical protein [Planctomycetaceae bacterium]
GGAATTVISRQLLTSIDSLTINGSADNDTLVIDDLNGLPIVQGTAPGVGNNPLLPGTAGLAFNGGAGTDAIDYRLDVAAANAEVTNTTYAMGNGAGGGNTAGDLQGEITTSNTTTGRSLQLYFTGLEPITVSGTTGGTLTVLGDNNANTITIADSPVPGNTRVTGQTGAMPFETFDFAADAYANMAIYGMGGGDTVDLTSLDALEDTLATIRLDGDSNTNTDGSADTIVVRSTSALLTATSTVMLFGGAGADTFILDSTGNGLSAAGTVDNIAVPVQVAPAGDEAGGGDSLYVIDSSDATGDTVTITGTPAGGAIEGITGEGTATDDVQYGAGDQVENVTIFSSNGVAASGDTININTTRVGTIYNLATQGGDDTINISSVTTDLFSGNLDAILGQVRIDTGAHDDLLNLSDYADSDPDVYTLDQTASGEQTRVQFNAAALVDDVLYNVNVVDLGLNASNAGNAGTLEDFRLIGSTGNDATDDNTYNINDTTATQTTTIEDGDASSLFGDATFNIEINTTTDNIVQAGAINTFRGFIGNDEFNVNFGANDVVPVAAGTQFIIEGGAQGGATLNDRDIVDLDVTLDTVSRTGATGVRFVYADPTKASGDVNVTGPDLTVLTDPGLGGDPTNPANGLDFDQVEQVNYIGEATNLDDIRVSGSTADDVLSVTPFSANEANVFLDGDAMIDTNTIGPAANNPGFAATTSPSAGPDLNLLGLAQATGLSFDGGGGVTPSDQLVINAPTENNGIGTPAASGWDGFPDASGDGATDIVGDAMNPGNIGNSTVRQTNAAFDDIDITDSRVTITNVGDGSAANLLLQTNFVAASFSAPADTPEIIVNTGEEVGTRTAGTAANIGVVADDVTVALSIVTHFQINGGAPPLPAGPALVGDRLNVATPAEANIFSDQAVPPNVSITSSIGGAPTQPATNNNIELLTVTPGNNTVNILGDNGNNPGTDQDDRFLINGQDADFATGGDIDGQEEFALLINGSNPIFVLDTRFLNVFGFEGADDITLDPYADDILAAGWDIDVKVDGGADVDDIFYGNVNRDATAAGQPGIVFLDNATATVAYEANGSRAGVSEDIVVAPTTTDGAGQIRSTNAADGHDIVIVEFVGTEDLNFYFNDGSEGDTDSLTVLGTNAADTAVVDFTNGDGLIPTADDTPWISFTSPAFDIERFARATVVAGANATLSALDSVSLVLGDGDDTVTVTGRATAGNAIAPTTLNIDSGNPSASDTINFTGTNNAGDTYAITPGASSDAGTAIVTLAGSPATTVNYTNTETLNVDGGGGTGTDLLTVNGTGGDDAISLTGTAALAGTARVNAGPAINFSNLGSDNNSVTLAAGLGSDTIVVAHTDDWQIDNVDIDGGSTADSDSVSITGVDAVNDIVTFTPLTASSADIGVTATSLTTYDLDDVESVSMDAQGQASADTLTTSTAGNYAHTPAGPGAGTVQVDSLLPLSYSNFETVTYDGTTLVVTGTADDDTVTLTATELTVNGNVTNVAGFDAAGNSLVLNLLGGNDTVTIESSALFPAGVTVNGGDSDQQSDSVTVNDASNGPVAIDFALGTVAGIVGGPITLDGIEDLTVNGVDGGTANDYDVTNYGATTDVLRVVLNGADIGNNDVDTIDIGLTGGPDTLNFEPTSIASASITGGGPSISVTNFNNAAGGLTVDAGLNVDRVNFIGSNAADTITASGSAAALTVGGAAWTPIDFTNINALFLSGRDGSDLFNVTSSATVPISVDGGDPIGGGAAGDVLNVVTGAAAVTVNPGAQNDEGNIIVTGSQPVTFDRIEAIDALTATGGATVNGTNGADSITVIARDVSTHAGTNGVRDFTVAVNDGLVLLFIDTPSLTINAEGGSDEIAIQTPAPNNAAWDVNVTVNGGLPSASDTVIVTGGAGADVATYTSTGPENGVLDITSQSSVITLDGVEHVTFDGAGGADSLTLNEAVAGTDDTILFTPAAGDNGALVLNSGLPLDFESIETRTIDGGTGSDTLTVVGTENSDEITIDEQTSFTAGQTAITINGETTNYTHNTDPMNSERVIIQGGGGADLIIAAPDMAALAVQVEGGDGGDVLRVDASLTINFTNLDMAVGPNFTSPGNHNGTISLSGNEAIDYRDIESVEMIGVNASDELTVTDDQADNTWSLGPGTPAAGVPARVSIDNRSPIEVTSFATINLRNDAGVDRFEVSSKRLPGGVTYNLAGLDTGVAGQRFVDTLVALGSGESDGEDQGNDPFTVTDTAITLGQSINYSQIAALEILSGEGDDTLLVDSSTAAIGTPIFYDGGVGRDTLQVTGDPMNVVFTGQTYTPGPTADAGRLDYAGATPMTINFTGLEPVQDSVPVATLTVNGTAAGNAISYTVGPNSGVAASFFAGNLTGFVAVDSFETIEFSQKTTLVINGSGGNDVVDVNNSTIPTGLTGITVNGDLGADELRIRDIAATTAVTIDATASTVTGATPVTITYGSIEGIDYNGTLLHAGPATALAFTGATSYSSTPGAAADVGTFLANSLPINYSGVTSAEQISVTGLAGASLTVNGTATEDTVTVAASGAVTLNGRAPIVPTTINSLTVNGYDGNDTFGLTGTHPYAGGVTLSGGGPSASDTVNLTGTGGADVVGVDLLTEQVTGLGGTISLPGIEHLTYADGGGADTVNLTNVGAASDLSTVLITGSGDETLNATGTTNDDTINVELGSAGQGRLYSSAGDPEITFGGITNTAFTVNGGTGGFDVMAVRGSAGNDILTSNGTSATSGAAVQFGTNLDRLDVFGYDGNDSFTITGNLLSGASPLPTTFHGGAGNDTGDASGVTNVGITFIGGTGDDVGTGGSANDRFEGGDGNDSAVGGPGSDIFFGGSGSDTFTWNQDDGSDTIEGDGGGTDVVVFNGATAAQLATEDVTLSAVGGRLLLNRTQGSVNLDIAGVEQLDINGQNGVENITVNDLSSTDLAVLNMNLGTADAATDDVTVHGRTTADSLNITSAGAGLVSVAGLAYGVNLSGVEVADDLIVNGNDGNDVIKAAVGVESIVTITLNGGAGDDYLSADATLNGGAGNDTLIGGAGADTINGGAGDDLIDARGGANVIDGGADTDTILVSGTAGGDTITTTHTAGNFNITGGLSAGTNTITSIEGVRVELDDASDTVTLNLLNAGNLNYTVLGGNPTGAVGDTLNVNAPNNVSLTAGPQADEGSVSSGGNTVSYDEIEAVGITFSSATAGVTINGTNADDDITVIGTGTDDFTVSVNGGPAISFTDATSLAINGLAGDDDIDVDVNLMTIAVSVDGGPHNASGGDTVTASGTNANWTGGINGAGSLVVDAQTLTITNGESVVFNGEAGDGTLTIEGTAISDTFTHTPGAADDAGTVRLNNGTDTLLAISYTNLGQGGTVDFDNNGGSDTLVAEGTGLDDSYVVTVATSTIALNSRVNLTHDITSGTIRLAAGDPTASDSATINGTTASEVIGVNVSTHQVSGLGATIDATGVENLTVAGGGTNADTFNVTELGGTSSFLNLNLTAGGLAGESITITGSNSDTTLSVTPTSATSGSVRANDADPTVSFSGLGTTATNATLTVSGGVGSDHVIVNGNVGANAIAVNRTAATVDVDGLQRVTVASEALTVASGLGDDTINVSGTGGPALTVDGGGQGATDTLSITN